MTTYQEQHEAAQVARHHAQFPKWKYIGTWSRKEKRLRLLKFSWLRGCGPGYGAPNHYNAALSVGIEWKVADLWIGAFWKGNRDEREVWVCVLPCVPIRFHYQRAYGGWIVSPGPEPQIPKEHRRRWWQWVHVV